MAIGQFRSSVWDPVLIVSQIVTMQCVFYIGLGFCVCVVDYIAGSHRSIDHLFGYQMLHFRALQGKLLMIASVLNALIGGLGLWYVIQRTKQCWDFAGTVYIIHIIVCCFVNGYFPDSASWWLTIAVSVIIMTVLGEYLCMRTELRAIPLSVGSKVDL